MSSLSALEHEKSVLIKIQRLGIDVPPANANTQLLSGFETKDLLGLFGSLLAVYDSSWAWKPADEPDASVFKRIAKYMTMMELGHLIRGLNEMDAVHYHGKVLRAVAGMLDKIEQRHGANVYRIKQLQLQQQARSSQGQSTTAATDAAQSNSITAQRPSSAAVSKSASSHLSVSVDSSGDTTTASSGDLAELGFSPSTLVNPFQTRDKIKRNSPAKRSPSRRTLAASAASPIAPQAHAAPPAELVAAAAAAALPAAVSVEGIPISQLKTMQKLQMADMLQANPQPAPAKASRLLSASLAVTAQASIIPAASGSSGTTRSSVGAALTDSTRPGDRAESISVQMAALSVTDRGGSDSAPLKAAAIPAPTYAKVAASLTLATPTKQSAASSSPAAVNKRLVALRYGEESAPKSPARTKGDSLGSPLKYSVVARDDRTIGPASSADSARTERDAPKSSACRQVAEQESQQPRPSPVKAPGSPAKSSASPTYAQIAQQQQQQQTHSTAENALVQVIKSTIRELDASMLSNTSAHEHDAEQLENAFSDRSSHLINRLQDSTLQLRRLSQSRSSRPILAPRSTNTLDAALGFNKESVLASCAKDGAPVTPNPALERLIRRTELYIRRYQCLQNSRHAPRLLK